MLKSLKNVKKAGLSFFIIKISWKSYEYEKYKYAICWPGRIQTEEYPG